MKTFEEYWTPLETGDATDDQILVYRSIAQAAWNAKISEITQQEKLEKLTDKWIDKLIDRPGAKTDENVIDEAIRLAQVQYDCMESEFS